VAKGLTCWLGKTGRMRWISIFAGAARLIMFLLIRPASGLRLEQIYSRPEAGALAFGALLAGEALAAGGLAGIGLRPRPPIPPKPGKFEDVAVISRISVSYGCRSFRGRGRSLYGPGRGVSANTVAGSGYATGRRA